MTELVLSCDGGARGNPGPAAIGAVLVDAATAPPTPLATVSERIGDTTNNVAEYRALIAGLEAAAPFGHDRILVRLDSELLVRQLDGTYRVKQPHLRPLHRRARELLDTWERAEVVHVPRAENAEADALVNAALDVP